MSDGQPFQAAYKTKRGPISTSSVKGQGLPNICTKSRTSSHGLPGPFIGCPSCSHLASVILVLVLDLRSARATLSKVCWWVGTADIAAVQMCSDRFVRHHVLRPFLFFSATARLFCEIQRASRPASVHLKHALSRCFSDRCCLFLRPCSRSMPKMRPPATPQGLLTRLARRQVQLLHTQFL